MSFWSRRKAIGGPAAHEGANALKRTLGWPQLMALGIGSIVGTGIFTLIGQGAMRAGPGEILSFGAAGLICACAALCYAEMATLIPASGSAYTYSYTALGEAVAWVVGWSLILEYTVVCSTVAVGWAGYAKGFLDAVGLHLPAALTAGPFDGGVVNLPAVFISLAAAALLAAGTRESAIVNTVLVLIKLAALALFVAIAAPRFQAAHLHPFMPFGFASHAVGGMQKGVMGAAALIFFAFYGFDAVSTAAEEAKRPARDLTIGIVGSMLVCTFLYMLIAATALGAVRFDRFADSHEPLASILQTLGHGGAATVIQAAAIIAMPTVILGFMYGQSRIFFVMARDGLLPRALAGVNARTGTPAVMTLITGAVVALVGGVFRLGQLAEIANSGTLAAFVAVAVSLMVMRRRAPDAARPFRAPLAWIVAPFAVLGCLYLFSSLAPLTQKAFLVWNVVGVAAYFAYGVRKSRLAGT